MLFQVTAEEILQTAAAAKEREKQDSSDANAVVMHAWNEYFYSIHILGENTLENAKKLGYLDVHELYPDIPRYPFAKFAEEFYSLPNPGEEFNAYM